MVKGARDREIINNIDKNDLIQLKDGTEITVEEYYRRRNEKG
jgi:hypothetical protein